MKLNNIVLTIDEIVLFIPMDETSEVTDITAFFKPH